MIFILVVIAVLVWNFTPVPQWVAKGQTWYEAVSGWISSGWHWINTIGKASGQQQ